MDTRFAEVSLFKALNSYAHCLIQNHSQFEAGIEYSVFFVNMETIELFGRFSNIDDLRYVKRRRIALNDLSLTALVAGMTMINLSNFIYSLIKHLAVFFYFKHSLSNIIQGFKPIV